MLFISKYLLNQQDSAHKKNEIIALKFALYPGNQAETANVSEKEAEVLQHLRNGDYPSTYQGNNREIIDKHYKVQKTFNEWIINTSRQTRQEAIERLKYFAFTIILTLAFIAFLYYAHANP